MIIIYDLLSSIFPHIPDYNLVLKTLKYIPTKSCMNGILRWLSSLIWKEVSSGMWCIHVKLQYSVLGFGLFFLEFFTFIVSA